MILLLATVFWVFVIWGLVMFFRRDELFSVDTGYGPSPFKRRRFLMDSNAEYGLFKVLVELYGDTYYIFPQVHYSHLIEASKSDWREFMRLRSRLERKSADFVLCNKGDVSPQLIIELDGPTHARTKRKERDEFIDAALNGTGLPILHIAVGPYTPESIKKAVDEALIRK